MAALRPSVQAEFEGQNSQFTFNNEVAMNVSRRLHNMDVVQWNFKHLEVIGLKYPSPDLEETRRRIPQMKVETRKYVIKEKEQKDSQEIRPRSPKKRESLLFVKPPKQKVVTVKVVVPRKKPVVAERNCVCTCEVVGKQACGGSFRDITSEIAVDSVENREGFREVEFAELVTIFVNYDKGVRKEASTAIRNIARRFQGSKLLSNAEVIQVVKMLDTDNHAIKEGVLLMISKLCASTLNVKKFLENGLMNELVDLMLLEAAVNVQTEAMQCLSKVVEKTEHADLWLEKMMSPETEALIGLLTTCTNKPVVPSSLQHAVLHVIKSLASQPKMARFLLDIGLENVADFTVCKNSQGEYMGSPEAQGLATQAFTNLISHDSATVEKFLLEHGDAIGNIVTLLQYSPCLQQQDSARFLSILACHQAGLTSIVSHNAVEHLLWAVTCSHCRRLREQASTALKNISANPDRAASLSAISQVVTSKTNSPDEPSLHSLTSTSGRNSPAASERNSPKPLNRHLSRTPSLLTPLDVQAGGSKGSFDKIIGEFTSVLSLAFQSDSISRSGSDRHFLAASDPRLTTPRKTLNDFSEKENYLSSLKVFANVLVVMSNMILIGEFAEGKTGVSGLDTRKLSHVAMMIQYGGLNFLQELQILSNKLLKANPPSFHNIDVANLSPKEITTTMKNSRTDLIFENATKKKESCMRYPDFGFEQNEIDFVKEAVRLLCLFSQTTAPDFDPCKEGLEVLQSSRPKGRTISFQRSALLVRNALRFSKGKGGHKLIRSSSSRSLSRSTSQTTLDTVASSKPLQSSTVSHDQSAPAALSTSAQDSREMMHYVKQSLLDAKVIHCLAPWITCGVYDIQANALKVIRYLLHSKSSTSAPGPLGITTPKEAWGPKTSPSLTSRSSTLSQRSSTVTSAVRSSTSKSKHVGVTCVRHVIQHCGPYLLDSLSPPVSPTLGTTSLMVLREAVINKESDTRLKLARLGCFAQVIEFIRGNEDDEMLQALGIVVIRILVGNNLSLKQLFLAHGGMNLIMALHECKEGIVKDEAALTLASFRRGESTRVHRRAKTADLRVKRRQKSSGCEDIWEQVGLKWKGQDEVVKVLQKFNVRY